MIEVTQQSWSKPRPIDRWRGSSDGDNQVHQKRCRTLRNVSSFLMLVILLVLLSAPVFAGTAEQWRSALDSIVNDVLAIHPHPFAKVGDLEWRRRVESFRRELPELSEPQRIVRLMQLIAQIGDGHTQIELEGDRYALWYPIRVYEFSDGYFVTSAHGSVRELAGAQVLEIASQPAGDVVNAARTLFGADNEFDSKERLYAVHNALLMKGLGYASPDGSLEATFRLKSGELVERILIPRPADEGRYRPGVPVFEWHFASELYGLPFGTPDEWITAYQELPSSVFQKLDENRPPFLQHLTRYTRRSMPENDAYYIQINQTDDSGMVGFMSEALKEVDVLKPKRLIVDMRYNFGGDGSTVTPMIHQFIRREEEKPWKELYLITGRKSFSAALGAIDAFIDHTDVTIIGEPAGAPLNSYGDAEKRPYPELELSLEVSSVRHQLSQSTDLRTFVPVHVPAPISFSDYAAGRDPAVDPILAGKEMRSIPVVALQEGGAAARRIYHLRKERYADLDWYRPPEEIELRFVGRELIHQGRFEDAVETALLNTEIHPYIWNTWYNLGNAQQAAGSPHKEKRFESFQCVVELAPTNWNVPRIQALFERENVNPNPAPGCPVGDNK
jgi:hypothetical protein